MPRFKEPPRVKGPYPERGGTRFRIRICSATGNRDLEDIGKMTLKRASAHYERLTTTSSQKTGQPPASGSACLVKDWT